MIQSVRICPRCSNDIVHKGPNCENNSRNSDRKKVVCRNCSNIEKKIKYSGEGNPFFNKRHSEELKSKFSNERKGIHKINSGSFKKGHISTHEKCIPKYSLDNLLLESNESFYWLGFILADGSFYKNTFEFSLQKLDIEHVKLLSKFLGNPKITAKKRIG